MDDQQASKTDHTTTNTDARKTQRFVRRPSGPRLAPDAAERQGRIARLAWAAFGGRDDAVAFLNDHHDGLGGRPIDLAIASETSCAAVEQVIEARGAAR
ncbi:hypothetical protein [Hephaestia mangrovi]|uniref:hypothetical protein n=1 Tax=Hephaestia mangrovi TaxID=2873268 RepID=UPI0034E1F0FE